MPSMTTGAQQFWRTMEECEAHAGLQPLLDNEFPPQAIEPLLDPIARRTFLKLMSASLALAGATGCTRQPLEQILPYVRQPEEIVPGKPLFYATAMTLGGAATGVLVESHEGRPTKIEGNPLHPSSLGATDAITQAAVLDLYDPDRAQTLTQFGEIRPWAAFLGELRAELASMRSPRGAGLRILTESVNSPTLAAQIDDVLHRFPEARWHQWDPVSADHVRAGARLAFGDYVSTQYRFDRADVVVSLDADFLGHGPGHLRYAREFTARRRPMASGNRLYAVESMPTSTGARADHRVPLRASEIERVARALAAALGIAGAEPGAEPPASARALVEAVRTELRTHRGTSILIAGEDQPAIVHALVHTINAGLGNVGQTVIYTDPIEAHPIDQMQSLRDLTTALMAGEVDVMVIVGANPVYTAPADLLFGDALMRAKFSAQLSRTFDETSERCHWHIPEAHFLEAWSDARGHDGTVSIVQPLIAPLYGGKSAHELLAAFGDQPDRAGYDIVRNFWRGAQPAADFERTWRRTVHDGVMAGTALAPRTVSLRSNVLAQPASQTRSGIEIAFRCDPTIADGRFSNNGWLQELPKPLTALTWENAIIASPALMTRLGAEASPGLIAGEHGRLNSPVVELRYRGRRLRGPLFPLPGHPDNAVTVHLGYGRTRSGSVGTNRGFKAGALLTSDSASFGDGVEIALTGDWQALACTQYHHMMEGRDLIRVIARGAQQGEPARPPEPSPPPSLYPPVPYADYKWGMAIDLGSCTGCNACVVACQAENNIPVVGKEEVLRGREMHWLRVDTYHQGSVQSPRTYFQPVPCMQCENAPCEVVCPVGATVHSQNGLNDMVYNRCVGTRYCSNNCPYKVRRFNFFLYQDWETPSLKLGRNPDVSIRSRGVMEKCTYCVQRINRSKIAAEKEDRRIRDGDIQTACQAVCPAEAIVFGDLNDPTSRVAMLKAEERNYSLLADLNTRPRTTYLAAITNRNPDLTD